MKNTNGLHTGLIVGALAGLAIACSMGSTTQTSAPQGTTASAPLYAVISAPNGPSIVRSVSMARTEAVGSTGATPQATGTCSGIGTLSGRTGNRLHGYSCTGYFFDIDSVATSSETTAIDTLPANQFVLFDGANCTGNMYVATNINMGGVMSEDEAVIANGHVFRYDPKATGTSDASTYYYVPAGEAATDANLLSAYTFNGAGGGACTTVSFPSGGGDKLYAVMQAPPLVSGASVTDLPTGPVSGPVLIATN